MPPPPSLPAPPCAVLPTGPILGQTKLSALLAALDQDRLRTGSHHRVGGAGQPMISTTMGRSNLHNPWVTSRGLACLVRVPTRPASPRLTPPHVSRLSSRNNPCIAAPSRPCRGPPDTGHRPTSDVCPRRGPRRYRGSKSVVRCMDGKNTECFCSACMWSPGLHPTVSKLYIHGTVLVLLT